MGSNIILDYFQGPWHLRRSVTEPEITMEGTAFFRFHSPDTLFYEEHAIYQLHGATYTCQQKWFFKKIGLHLKIEKQDHSLLHKFILPVTSHFPFSFTHTHRCQQDFYKALFSFNVINQFSLWYDITGPRKDYQILTLFKRGK